MKLNKYLIPFGYTLAMLVNLAAAQKEKPVGPPRIIAIEVRGNNALNKASIVATSGLKVGDFATPGALNEARNRLLGVGYYGMQRTNNPEEAVKFFVVDVNPATNEGKLLIQVEENDVVQGFNITSGPIPPKDVLDRLQTRPGFVLNINTLRADIDRIVKYYSDKGYIANIDDAGFGLTNGILNIPIIVGRIPTRAFLILGLSASKERLARRELSKVLKPGDFYNSKVLQEALKRLERTGIYRAYDDLRFDFGRSSVPGEVALVLSFREKK